MPVINSDKQKIWDMDDMDLNAFSIKPDALVFYTLVQIVGALAKNIEQGKPLIEGLMIKCMLVDDLEDLCEAQDYIKTDLVDAEGNFVKDPYFVMVGEQTKKLELENIDSDSEPLKYWQRNSVLARHKMKYLEKKIFGGASKFKEIQY